MLTEPSRQPNFSLTLPEEPLDFRGQVMRDITGEPVLELRQSDNVERWYETLLQIRGEIDVGLSSIRSTIVSNKAAYQQLHQQCIARGEAGRAEWQGLKQEWSAADAEAERDRQQLMELKQEVDLRVRAAKALRSSQRTERYADTLVRERDDARARVIELEHAIETWADHRCDSLCDDGCAADTALVRMLNS